jgi:tRNA threonylcarbamoyladenosine biosynthesis protein TsaE
LFVCVEIYKPGPGETLERFARHVELARGEYGIDFGQRLVLEIFVRHGFIAARLRKQTQHPGPKAFVGGRGGGLQLFEIRFGLRAYLGAVIYHRLRNLFAKRMIRTFNSEQELVRFAADFGRELRAGDVVGLSGPLGAGKTTFVKAVVQGRLKSDPASSPTFTFWHRYPGAPPIDHLDLYRVDDPSEITELGLDEAFDGSSIVLVEWWRNAPALLPPVRYEIEIEGKGSEPRRLGIRRRRAGRTV